MIIQSESDSNSCRKRSRTTSRKLDAYTEDFITNRAEEILEHRVKWWHETAATALEIRASSRGPGIFVKVGHSLPVGFPIEIRGRVVRESELRSKSHAVKISGRRYIDSTPGEWRERGRHEWGHGINDGVYGSEPGSATSNVNCLLMPPLREYRDRKFVVLTKGVGNGQQLLLDYGESYWAASEEEAHIVRLRTEELRKSEEMQHASPKVMIYGLGKSQSKFEAFDDDELLQDLLADLMRPADICFGHSAKKPRVSHLNTVLQAAEQLASQQIADTTHITQCTQQTADTPHHTVHTAPPAGQRTRVGA
jgi:hypothetical protein